jgi:flagellar protein FlaC
MGMMDWMDGHDDPSSDGENTVATDGLGFDEELDDLSDDFGDFGDDDFGDDDFGGADETAVAKLEDRISDLENELSTVSSGMNTVRQENKQIGETVEELDDTIRKLLDIYEMVTRGINPFVDDAREMGGLEGGGAFGIFDAEEEQDEHLDPDVANADAESFFDEDFGGTDPAAGEMEAELAAEDELVEEERDDPAEVLDDGAAGDDAAGGSSFDDLKAEYDENDGWAEGDTDGDDEAALDAAESADLAGAESAAADVGAEPDAAEEPAVFEADARPNGDETVPAETFEFDHGDADDAVGTPSNGRAAAADPTAGEEYLTAMPASYVAESVALEWTRFLVAVGGAIGAARALRQYREQDWISRPVERAMNAHVRNAASTVSAEDPRDLRVEHHKESLTYVSRLAGDLTEARLLEELSAEERRGGRGGLRR